MKKCLIMTIVIMYATQKSVILITECVLHRIAKKNALAIFISMIIAMNNVKVKIVIETMDLAYVTKVVIQI